MKKFMTITVIGIILVTHLVPTILSARQALAQPTIVSNVERVHAFWPEAEVQLDEFTLTNLRLIAAEIHERASKTYTVVNLDFEILRDGELWCLGCGPEITTTENVLQVRGFNSATLSPVTMDVCVAFDENFNCTESIPITIEAQWEGVGSLEQDTQRLQIPGEVVIVLRGTFREATATGSVNGQDLGQATDEQIFRGNDLFNELGP